MKLTFCSKAGCTPSKTHLLNLRFCINKMWITAPTSWGAGTLKWENSPNVFSTGAAHSSAECQLPALLVSEWTPCTLHSRSFGLISYSNCCCCSKPLSVAPNRCTQVQLDSPFSAGPSPGLLTSNLRLLCSCHAEILGTHVHATRSQHGEDNL